MTLDLATVHALADSVSLCFDPDFALWGLGGLVDVADVLSVLRTATRVEETGWTMVYGVAADGTPARVGLDCTAGRWMVRGYAVV